MKGLLLFVAGLLCGGALVAWLLVGREASMPAPVEQTLPAPLPPADGVTDLEPGARDLVVGPGPEPAPMPAPEVAVDPFDRVPVPLPDAPPVPEPSAGAAAGEPDTPVSSAAAEPVAPPAPPDPAVLAALRAMKLLMPVQGIEPAQLSDTYADARGTGRLHDAIDIMAPTGRPVRAVADGRIVKLFTSVPGGLTLYQFDKDEQVAFYYAHLDRYADGITEGQPVKRGEVIGYVGWTGNANEAAPHLHFAIFVLDADKKWWKGTAVNPYPLLRRAATEAAGAP